MGIKAPYPPSPYPPKGPYDSGLRKLGLSYQKKGTKIFAIDHSCYLRLNSLKKNPAVPLHTPQNTLAGSRSSGSSVYRVWGLGFLGSRSFGLMKF